MKTLYHRFFTPAVGVAAVAAGVALVLLLVAPAGAARSDFGPLTVVLGGGLLLAIIGLLLVHRRPAGLLVVLVGFVGAACAAALFGAYRGEPSAIFFLIAGLILLVICVFGTVIRAAEPASPNALSHL